MRRSRVKVLAMPPVAEVCVNLLCYVCHDSEQGKGVDRYLIFPSGA